MEVERLVICGGRAWMVGLTWSYAYVRLAKPRSPVNDSYMSATPEEIRKLPVEDRLRLVEDIWESIRSEGDSVPLTPTQRDELERRLASHRADPGAGDDIATVLGRICSAE